MDFRSATPDAEQPFCPGCRLPVRETLRPAIRNLCSGLLVAFAIVSLGLLLVFPEHTVVWVEVILALAVIVCALAAWLARHARRMQYCPRCGRVRNESSTHTHPAASQR